jgi:hypothetical protein
MPFRRGGGVIVAWSAQALELDEGLKLKVFRPTADSATFTVVGESGFMDFPGPGLQQFATRIPVEAGDTIGYKIAPNSFTGCVLTTFEPADVTRVVPGDPPVGSTFTTTGTAQNETLNIAAVVEADSDNDGFGDETQDNCPTQGGEGDGCPPTTMVTKAPKNKTKRKRATFEFTGTDSRAIASFQCSLDSGAFASCTSPHKVKVRKGKHHFEVQAIDQAGNAGTPATDDWKVKKQRKK